MPDSDSANPRPRPLGSLLRLGGRAASFTVRPVAGAAVATVRPLVGVAAMTTRPLVGAGAHAGRAIERRAVDRALDGPELERLTGEVLDSPHTKQAIRGVLDSDGAEEVIAGFFDSGLFDQFIHRLSHSDGLWRLVDEVAASPAVTAAIAQQSLGFADQIGDVTRTRSRSADEWLERAVRRLIGALSGHASRDGGQPGTGER